MNKKIFFYCFFLIALFFMNSSVFAIDRSQVQVSCIYADAKVVVKSYDNFQNVVYMNINDYPTVNNYKVDYQVSEYRLFFPAGYGVELQSNYINYYCRDHIKKYLVEEYDVDLEERANSLVYSFFASDDRLSASKNHDIYYYLKEDPRSGWSQFWGTNKKRVPTVIDLTPNDGNTNVWMNVPLVAERIEYISSDKAAKTCNYVHKSSQASGSDSYFTLTWHPHSSENVFYASDGESITYNSNSTLINAVKEGKCETDAKCLCVKASTKNMNSAEGTTEYTFSRPRHDVIPNNSDVCSCAEGYVSYSYHSSDSMDDESGASIVQVCSSIPETTKVLKEVIRWSQILVPALVIVLTGIEIGKLVVAGNLDEELPKRKKSMIVRLIVMIVFFFLPLIVKVLFTTVFDDGILGVGGIDCLFN